MMMVYRDPNVNTRDIERAAIACFAFLPPNHQLNTLNRTILPQHGLQEILVHAEEYAKTFWDIHSRWQDEFDNEARVRYGGGSVFDEGIRSPVDRVARRVTLPKNRA